MNPEELASRERFYGRMLWVVNAKGFLNRFQVMQKLPPPDSEHASGKNFFLTGILDAADGIENPENRSWSDYQLSAECKGGRSLVRVHTWTDASAPFLGHHHFLWKNPRTVWFSAVAPVYLDFGQERLWRLMIYDARGMRCVQSVTKAAFLASAFEGTL